MTPFTAKELADALPQCSMQAQYEIQNVMLKARVEEYESITNDEGYEKIEFHDGE